MRIIDVVYFFLLGGGKLHFFWGVGGEAYMRDPYSGVSTNGDYGRLVRQEFFHETWKLGTDTHSWSSTHDILEQLGHPVVFQWYSSCILDFQWPVMYMAMPESTWMCIAFCR